jgi:hypothetical protein
MPEEMPSEPTLAQIEEEVLAEGREWMRHERGHDIWWRSLHAN